MTAKSLTKGPKPPKKGSKGQKKGKKTTKKRPLEVQPKYNRCQTVMTSSPVSRYWTHLDQCKQGLMWKRVKRPGKGLHLQLQPLMPLNQMLKMIMKKMVLHQERRSVCQRL